MKRSVIGLILLGFTFGFAGGVAAAILLALRAIRGPWRRTVAS